MHQSVDGEIDRVPVPGLTAVPGRVRLAIVLGALTALGPFSIDTYLPALPSMTRSLHSSASAAQLTLTAMLVGLAAGQLAAGPISDAVGRRLPTIIGLFAFALVSVLCSLAPGVGSLAALRLFQGFFVSAGLVVARAVVRDLFSGYDAARFFARLMLVNGTAPMLAPVLGGQLLRLGSWRLVFVALAILGVVMATVAVLFLPETWPPERRHDGGRGTTARVFRALLSDRPFLGYGLACSFAFAALFCYISGATFVLQDIYGLSPQQFSAVFAANALGILVLGQVSRRLVGRYSPRQILGVGVVMSATGGAATLVSSLVSAPLAVVLPSLFLVVASIGLITPNATALALADHPRTAGSASALLGTGQTLLGALASPLVGVAGPHSMVPMGVLMTVLGTASVMAFRSTRQVDQ